jgi:hypothetical protein
MNTLGNFSAVSPFYHRAPGRTGFMGTIVFTLSTKGAVK